MDSLDDANLNEPGQRLAIQAVAAILPHEHEDTDTKDDPGGDAGSLRAALEDVLRGPSPFHPGRDQASRRSFAGARQIQALGERARNLDLGAEIGRGGEHLVFRQAGEAWVRKLTLMPEGLLPVNALIGGS